MMIRNNSSAAGQGRNGDQPQAHAGIELSDEAVIERVRLGEVELFELIMRRHNRRLYRLARAMLGGGNAGGAEHEAEDIVQEAYVRAYEHLHQFEGRSRFATWLTRIAANVARARIRSRRRERRRLARAASLAGGVTAVSAPSGGEPMSISDQRAARTPPPDQRACAAELRAAIAAALESLPRPMRTVFILREVEGLDTAETAQSLGITPTNVKVRLHRARSELCAALERTLGAEARFLYDDFDGQRCDRIVARVFAQLGPTTARSAAAVPPRS